MESTVEFESGFIVGETWEFRVPHGFSVQTDPRGEIVEIDRDNKQILVKLTRGGFIQMRAGECGWHDAGTHVYVNMVGLMKTGDEHTCSALYRRIAPASASCDNEALMLPVGWWPLVKKS